MAAPKRTRFQIQRDRYEIAKYYLRGLPQWRIAKIINEDEGRDYTITRQTVGRDIKMIQKAWKESSLIDMAEEKQIALAKVDNLERTYWDAWERSCEDAETKRLEGTLAPGEDQGKPTKQILTRKGQAGDPRFLTGIQWCIERRCKILGIDAPSKREHGGMGGGPIQVEVEVEDVNETRKRLLASVQKIVGEDDAPPEEDLVQ